MQKGGRYKIHIPGRSAYGQNPPPGSPIGPNEDLDFDVHVVQVVPNAALMPAAPSSAAAAQPVSRLALAASAGSTFAGRRLLGAWLSPPAPP